MIHRLYLRWQMRRALAARRAARAYLSASANKSVSTAIHNRYVNDRLLKEARTAQLRRELQDSVAQA